MLWLRDTGRSEKKPSRPRGPEPGQMGLAMTDFDIDRSSSAWGRAADTIDAPLGLVWDRLTSIADWPQWNGAVTRIEVSGPTAIGTNFRWKAGGLPIRSRIECFNIGRCFGWSGKAPLIHARHIYWLSEVDRQVHVEKEESFSGPLARLLPKACSGMIVSALKQGLAALKQSCETSAVEPVDQPRKS
jgi:hypothetical protein